MKNKNYNILMVGHFGAKNIGDELILMAEAFLLNEQLPDTTFYIYSYDLKTQYYNDFPYKYKLIQAFNIRNIFKSLYDLFTKIKDVDIIIIGGGGIIQDKYFVYRPLSTLLPAFIGFLYGKPVYGFSLGIYKLNSGINQKLFKLFVKNAQHISVRDKTSMEYLKKYSADSYITKTSNIPDSALAFCNRQLHPEKDNTSDNKRYAVIMLREVFRDYEDEVVNLISKILFERSVNDIVMINFENNAIEAGTILRFKNKLLQDNADYSIEIIDFPPINDFLSLINGSSYIISGRLHGCIAAHVLEKSLIGLSYEEKVSDFCFSYGIPFLNINELTGWKIQEEPTENNKKNKLLQAEKELFDFTRRIIDDSNRINHKNISIYTKGKLIFCVFSWGVILLLGHVLKITYKRLRT